MKESGFTIIEVMVAAFLLLIILTMVGSHIVFQKETFTQGSIRSRLNQNLRGTLDIIGTDIRIGGENLPLAFPTFLLADGGAGSDTFTVRRSVIEDALPLCTAIAAGSNLATITVADNASTTQGCDYTGNKGNFTKWSTYRTEQGGVVKAYIYNLATREGEFIYYTGESDLGSSLMLTSSTTNGSYTYNYPAGNSAIYVIEEWSYQVQGDELQIVQNGETAEPLTVMFGVDLFKVSAEMQDGTTDETLIASDNWTQIRTFQVEITGSETKGGDVIQRFASSRFFPRNILSF